jgi:hypothetical protein
LSRAGQSNLARLLARKPWTPRAFRAKGIKSTGRQVHSTEFVVADSRPLFRLARINWRQAGDWLGKAVLSSATLTNLEQSDKCGQGLRAYT